MGALCTRGGGDVDVLVDSGMKLFWDDAGSVLVVAVGTASLVALGGAAGGEALPT